MASSGLGVGNVEHRVAQPVTVAGSSPNDRPSAYLATVCTIAMVGLAAIFALNRSFAPEMYSEPGAKVIGEALARGENYAVFDLNVNIRQIRSAQIANLKSAPDVAIIGASQWQEAHGDLLPNSKFLNVHVHRDYYEDLLAMTEIFVRNNKLPRTMVIAIREDLFKPIQDRKDHLWLPAVADYRAMAERLGLETHSTWATLPTPRWREQISVPMLLGNATRWFNAETRPGPTERRNSSSLDTLLPEGSIVWSQEHRRQFTAERAIRLARAHAAAVARTPKVIDPKGVAAIDALFGYLGRQGVEVVLALPPFNPVFFDSVRDTPYMENLRRVEKVVQQLASKHNLRTIGSYDPATVGCTAEMFIDSEHSNPQCLVRVLEQLGPAALPRGSLVVSENEVAIPQSDLARQQILIIQNARAQWSQIASAGSQDKPHSAPAAVEMIVASAEPVVSGVRTPSRQDTGAAEVAVPKRVHAARRTVENAAGSDSDAEPANPVRSRKIRIRIKRNVTEEFVWPGDATAGVPGRRQVRLQRFSAADRR